MPTPLLSNVIAGPFNVYYTPPTTDSSYTTGTLNTTNDYLGLIGEGGIKEVKTFEIEEYKVDLLGETIVEGIHAGGNLFLEFQLEEINRLRIRQIIENLGVTRQDSSSSSVAEGQVGIPGTVTSYRAGMLTCRPFSGSSAYAETTPCRTYGLVQLASGFELSRLLSYKRRFYPIRLRCYPYNDGSGNYVWYTKSANP
jgi:hypothetical protein